MCKRILLTVFLCAATVGAYLLRTAPPSGMCVAAAAAATSAIIILALLQERQSAPLSSLRPVLPAAVLLGAGALLLALGSAWELVLLYPSLRCVDAVTAAAVLLGAVGLIGLLRACLGGKTNAGAAVLLPLLAAAVKLLAAYRSSSSDPEVGRYGVRMLFLALCAICCALGSDFVFSPAPKRRETLVSCAAATILAGAALPTTDSLPQAMETIGAALAALGFFLALLFGMERDRPIHYELVDDPFSTARHRPLTAPVGEDAAPPLPLADPADARIEPEDSAPPMQPAEEFDLARVDRLLMELERESAETAEDTQPE